jgi:hypothetical protein
MSNPTALADALRVRRHQPTRLESFVDASFAFAVTLLAISIGHLPTSVSEMLHALRGIPAFALSFLLIARVWLAHRAWSRHYDIEDTFSIQLSLVLVFLVLVFVYPLRFIFGLLFAWLSHNYLTDQPIEVNSIHEYRMAFEVYGIGFAAIAGVFVLLYRHAAHAAERIGLDAAERIVTQMHSRVWMGIGLVALTSAACAAAIPLDERSDWVFTIPGGLYALNGVIAPLIRRRAAQRLAAAA